MPRPRRPLPSFTRLHVCTQKTSEGLTPAAAAISAEDGTRQVCKKLSQFDAHLFLAEDTRDEACSTASASGPSGVRPASRSKVYEYTGALLRELGRGNDRRSNAARPFRMKCMGSAYILVGGDPSKSVLECMQAVEEDRPVLVFEGSGGYADLICNMIRRVEEVVKSPSIDDYRNCLGAVSPRTSSVVSSGCVTIVRQGTSTELVQRMIEKALSYDETLHNAWLKYALWDYNAQYCRKVFLYLQMLVLALGILTITLSIFQTFLQLRHPQSTGVTKAGATTQHTNDIIGHLYTWTGLVVVILPVGLSLVEAIETKLNPGGRWVALRSASESLLREIFMYRTQVRSYSAESVKRNNVTSKQARTHPAGDGGGDGGTGGDADDEGDDEAEGAEGSGRLLDKKVVDHMNSTDGAPYESRQEKLSQWVEHLIQELKDGDCANNSLIEYQGPLPPWHIQEGGDEGWKDLNPDEYVFYRLAPLIGRYERAAKYYEQNLTFFTISNYFLGALGTLLAALSSVPPFDIYNLQAWVSLTTGVSNAVTRYMDYARMDFLQKKSNKVKMELIGVQSWWDSRGNEAGTHQIRAELVTQVEALVTGEFLEWGGQMKKAMDKAKKEKKDSEENEVLKKLKGMEEIEKLSQLKGMGLADISADSLASALENPDGPEAAKIKDSMERLSKQLEKSTGVNPEQLLEEELAKEALRHVEALKATPEQFLDDTGALLNVNLGGISMNDFVPAATLQRIKNPKDRRKMFREVGKLNPACISRADCIGLFASYGEQFRAGVQGLSQRQMLETVRQAIVEQLHEELIAGLKNFNICIYDLIPRDDMVEELLLELRDVGKVAWREMETAQILGLLKNKEICSAMQQLNEVALRGLLKRADKLFKSKTALVFQAAVEKVAKLDVEELFEDTSLKAAVFDVLDDLQAREQDITFIPRDALLKHLPEKIRTLPHVANKPQAQLVEYLTTVKNGFSASRKFSSFRSDMLETVEELDSQSAANVLKSVLNNKKLCDRFFFSVTAVTQLDINRSDKKMLMRQLAMSPAFSPDMIEDLKYLSEPVLKMLMSRLKSAISCSYQAQVFDLLCDSVTTFDLRNLLADAEDREKFVNQVREFKGVDLDTCPKGEMVTTLAYKSLVVKFLKLGRDQIAELVERSLILMGNPFHSGVFTCAMGEHFSPEDPEDLAAELSKWDDESADKLCLSLTRFDVDCVIPPSLNAECKNVAQHVATEEEERAVTNYLMQMFTDQSLQSLFNGSGWEADVHLAVVLRMRELLDERVLASIFLLAAQDLPHQLSAKFQAVFIHPKLRKLMMDCLSNMAHSDYVELTRMDPDVFVESLAGFDPLKTDFLTRLRTEALRLSTAGLKDLVLHLMNDVIVNTPYALFLKLCMQNSTFDLRELLDEPQVRRLIAVVLLRCQQEGFFRYAPDKKHEILDACDNLSEYEGAVNDLRNMSERQLAWFTNEVLDFFSTKQLGIFFAKVITVQETGVGMGGAVSDKVEYRLLIEAVTSIRCFLTLNPVVVRKDFRMFDADQFFSLLTEEEKVRILRKYIADDFAVQSIAEFSQAQFTRLFSHLGALPSSRADVGQGVANRESVDMKAFYEGVPADVKNFAAGFNNLIDDDMVCNTCGLLRLCFKKRGGNNTPAEKNNSTTTPFFTG